MKYVGYFNPYVNLFHKLILPNHVINNNLREVLLCMTQLIFIIILYLRHNLIIILYIREGGGGGGAARKKNVFLCKNFPGLTKSMLFFIQSEIRVARLLNK